MRIKGTVSSEVTVCEILGSSVEAVVGTGNSTKAVAAVPCTCSRHTSRTRRRR